MSTSDLTSYKLTPADEELHLMDIAQITADEFAGGQYVEEISQTYIGNCHYDFDTTRLIWVGDQLIHHWGVWGYPMRVGTASLKVAGIGAVTTREPYRKQGLMADAAQDSFKAMYDNIYDLSILRGRHYVKFGYVRAWNYVTTKLKSDEIPDYEIQYPFLLLEQEHLGEVIKLYNKNHNKFSGTAVRPTYRFLSEESGVYGWFDRDGKLAGYVRAKPTDDKKSLQCLEATGDTIQGLAVLKSLFEGEEYETLNFFTIHQHHPMLALIRKGACIVENRYFHNTGWRVKIINLYNTLEKLRPLFEERMQKSHLMDWCGEIHIDAGEHQANLKIDSGQIRVVDAAQSSHTLRGGAAIARFLIGSDEPEEIIQQEEIECTGDADALASVLFPNLYPMLSHWDEY